MPRCMHPERHIQSCLCMNTAQYPTSHCMMLHCLCLFLLVCCDSFITCGNFSTCLTLTHNIISINMLTKFCLAAAVNKYCFQMITESESKIVPRQNSSRSTSYIVGYVCFSLTVTIFEPQAGFSRHQSRALGLCHEPANVHACLSVQFGDEMWMGLTPLHLPHPTEKSMRLTKKRKNW